MNESTNILKSGLRLIETLNRLEKFNKLEIIEKDIQHPEGHKKEVEEANKRIREYRIKQSEIIQNAKNYFGD